MNFKVKVDVWIWCLMLMLEIQFQSWRLKLEAQRWSLKINLKLTFEVSLIVEDENWGLKNKFEVFVWLQSTNLFLKAMLKIDEISASSENATLPVCHKCHLGISVTSNKAISWVTDAI